MASACLAAYLRRHNKEVECFDFGVDLFRRVTSQEKQTFEMSGTAAFNSLFPDSRLKSYVNDWAQQVIRARADIVGFSVYETTTRASLLLAGKIKELSPETIVILGGPSCSRNDRAYDFMKKEYIDLVAVGEGEVTLLELLEKLEAGEPRDCLGVIEKKDGQVLDWGDRPLIRNLDSLPFPDFSDFCFDHYAKPFDLPVMMSRGCVGNCKFCSEKAHWGPFRCRSAESVFAELKSHVETHGVRRFWFQDSLINGNVRVLSRLCDLILEDGLDITWAGKARASSQMTEELCQKLRRAGCEAITYGLESGSQRVLDAMNKGVKVNDMSEAVRNTHNAGIRVEASFLIGYPTETKIDFLRTLWFTIRNRKYLDRIPVPPNACVIMPNSYLGEHPKEFGIVQPKGNEGAWFTEDGANTVEERERRLWVFRLLRYIPGVNLDWSRIEAKEAHLQASATQQMPLTKFEAEVLMQTELESMSCGQIKPIVVAVKNSTETIWRRRKDAGAFPIGASYHWYTPNGQIVVWDGNRAYLQEDLLPGRKTLISLSIRAPETEGVYALEPTLVQENLAWFDRRGLKTKRVRITVCS